MLKQDERFYKSTEIEWRKDIDKSLEFVYEKGRGLTGQVRDISISKNEMMDILKYKEKPTKSLLYALIIHAKRYAIKSGEFYMTYEQITESVHISNSSVSKYLKELVEDGEIIIVRQGEKRNNSYLDLPNKFIIKNSSININIINKNDYIVHSYSNDLYKEYDNNIVNLFNKKELKKQLPDKQYREISRLYA
jgi:broad-specificity NMP kinase